MSPEAKTIPHEKSRTTAVRTTVAKVELTPSNPSLANTVVNAANKADANAYTSATKSPSPIVSFTVVYAEREPPVVVALYIL